jgi:predicted DNA-binding protein (UPF0251 family)
VLAKRYHRLFNLGAVGTMTDAQLLDWFISRRDEAAAAAFEALMTRHGPMVLRVCRSVLQEEIDSLPERLRAPVVLCYLEGLTYEAAARRLALSEMTLRGRLARARERLRRGLGRRGVTVPAGLLIAGATGRAQGAIPAPLAVSTTRIALGHTAGNAATLLAQAALNTMLLNQLKVATAHFLVGIGLT